MPPAVDTYLSSTRLTLALAESTRTAFGGGYQILPESEAPLTAVLGRNGALFGTPVNSKAATVLLGTVPLTIGFTGSGAFAVIDQRKAAGEGRRR